MYGHRGAILFIWRCSMPSKRLKTCGVDLRVCQTGRSEECHLRALCMEAEVKSKMWTRFGRNGRERTGYDIVSLGCEHLRSNTLPGCAGSLHVHGACHQVQRQGPTTFASATAHLPNEPTLRPSGSRRSRNRLLTSLPPHPRPLSGKGKGSFRSISKM